MALRALQGAAPDPVPEYAGTPPAAPVEQFTAAGYAPSAAVDPGTPASLLMLQGEAGAEYWLTFQNFFVITRYNKSPRYAMAVMQLAPQIEPGVATETATAEAVP